MEIAPKYLAALGLLAVSPWLIASAPQDRSSDNSTMVSITGQGTAQQDTRLAVMQAGGDFVRDQRRPGLAPELRSDGQAALRASPPGDLRKGCPDHQSGALGEDET